MEKFTVKTFNIPTLTGISAKTNEEHLKLYAGYAKNANLVLDTILELKKDAEKNAYLIGELNRRFSFEYNGIRNHELYFSSLEGGAKTLAQSSDLKKAIENNFGPFDTWISLFKTLAMTRGIGWAVLFYDKKGRRMFTSWVDEQHIGQLSACVPLLALDMWEHSYVADYQPSGKKQYVEDFFANLNWDVIEKNFSAAA